MVKRNGFSEEKIAIDQSCLIHCNQTLPSSIGQHTVLEYCDINAGSSVGNNCIISNVTIPAGAHVPDDTFMTTVCVAFGDVTGLFVTVVFGVGDNVKKMARSDDLGKLQYLSLPLDSVLTLLDVQQVRLNHSTPKSAKNQNSMTNPKFQLIKYCKINGTMQKYC